MSKYIRLITIRWASTDQKHKKEAYDWLESSNHFTLQTKSCCITKNQEGYEVSMRLPTWNKRYCPIKYYVWSLTTSFRRIPIRSPVKFDQWCITSLSTHVQTQPQLERFGRLEMRWSIDEVLRFFQDSNHNVGVYRKEWSNLETPGVMDQKWWTT